MKMSSKLLLFTSMIVCYVTAYANEEVKFNQRAINNNFMKINEKIDYLSEKMEKLELNSSTGNHAISQLMSAIKELNKKSEEFNNKTEELNKKYDELNKNNKEILEMKSLLLQLIETTNDQKMHKRATTSDVINEMTSQCTSFCHSKINTWANETSDKFSEDLEKLDFNIENSPFNTHLKAVNACEPNPCSNGGQCALSSYQCTKCPHLTSGTHCEKLICNAANRCFQFKNTLYVVFEESMAWGAAYNKCLNEGMQLAMLKDALTTEDVVRQLKTVYEPAKHFFFWFGLSDNGTNQFLWVDGSPLGAYTGGQPAFKTSTGDKRWATLYLHGTNVYWHPMLPSQVHNYIHYPLCEKLIPMR